jgi:DNA polymerase elongation subunit (family B)
MARVEQFKFYSFTWSSSEEETNEGKRCLIRAYGWNEKLESMDLIIEQFLLPVIIELDENITWTPGAVSAVKNRLQQMNSKKDMQPVRIDYEERQRLYYAYVEKLKTIDPKTGHKYRHKRFPYLIAWFHSSSACSSFAATLSKRDINILGIGNIRLRCHGTERKITPVLKFLGIRELPSAGWMRGAGIKATKEDQESTRKHEYFVNFQDLVALSEEESMKMPIPLPKAMSFDNEANSTYLNSMPKAHRPGDKTFQIAYTMLDPPNAGRKKTYRKYLISMGNPDDIEGVTIFRVKSEADVYVTLSRKMREEDPEVVIGFNILGWDINYMIQRCRDFCRCLGEFDLMGCIIGKHAEKAEISWDSKGAGKNKFEYLDAEGRVFIDLLPYIKRNYKLDNYRLATCCEQLLKTANKDDLKPKDIFKAWRKHLAAYDKPENEKLQREASAELGRVGKYACQDSWVTLQLYEKLSIWADLTESATVCQVPMFYMYTEGQQIKMYSQVYRYAFHNNIVVESKGYIAKDDEYYEGAYVTDPKKGLYRKIVPFDFAGLYPSIMMAHNIDHSKLVADQSIPNEDCWVMEWSTHRFCNCPKDEFPGKKAPKMKDGTTKRVCAEYKYRWLRHEVSGKGVVPTLLEGLIAARKKTRKIIAANAVEIKALKKIVSNELLSEENFSALKETVKTFVTNKYFNEALEIVQIKLEKGLLIRESPLHTSASQSSAEILTEEERIKILERIEQLESLNLVLDRRQNAYKVNANSMYGAMGARVGSLPFLPAAMCVTYMGRTNIKRVNKFIEEEKSGIVIYNDTDSAYCFFPDFENKTIQELWAFAKQIVSEVKVLFPPPISLEFEEKVYEKFLILTKKRYAAIAINEDGKIDDKLVKRGIILQRRDNCTALRNVYQDLIYKIFDKHEKLIKFNSEMKLIREAENIEIASWKSQCEQMIREYASKNDCEDILDTLMGKFYRRHKIKQKAKPRIKSEEKPKKKNAPKSFDKLEFPSRPEKRSRKFAMNNSEVQSLLELIIDSIRSLFQWKYGYKHFVITKQITRDVKEYKDPNKLPGHVKLGMRMQKRGIPVGGGTRVEYVILKNGPYRKTETQSDKIEDVNYFSEFREILRIELLSYLKQFINPIDELCEVVMGLEDFVKEQFEIRLAHSQLTDQISELRKPKIEFDDPPENKKMIFLDK